MLDVYFAFCKREILLCVRQPFMWLLPIVFATLTVFFFALGVQNDSSLTDTYLPVIWLGLFFSSMLNFSQIFKDDFADGSLVQYIISSTPLTLIVLAKITSYFLLFLCPLTLVLPILALSINMPIGVFWLLFQTLLLGSLILSTISVFVASVTVALPSNQFLLPVLLLPLMLPAFIFGLSTVELWSLGFNHYTALAILLAIACGYLAVFPFLSALSLKLTL